MKVVFFDTDRMEREYIGANFSAKGCEIAFEKKPLSVRTAKKYQDAQVVSVFAFSNIGAEQMRAFPKLKAICTRSTGFDHIDLQECKRKSISVHNVPTYGEETVAEFAFALMLALSRRIVKANEQVRRADFGTQGLRGFDLMGKTIGVIGAGHIGQNVVRIAHGFGMRVLVHDPFADKKLAKKLGFALVSLGKLLAQSHVISLHAPYTKGTHHLIGMHNIGKVKRGSLLINTSRGPLVETDAVLYGLQKGILGGAGLDVIEEERFMRESCSVLSSSRAANECSLRNAVIDHVLRERDDVIMTPHCAFDTKDAMLRIVKTTLESIAALSKGKKINTVG
ncbi:hydroxyacid dehydrogenase [Candidatus Micrarchaeota archaeon]|nr:hydroxyacid dehydrogenase [Candidatus Micrarchaeota archaeon]